MIQIQETSALDSRTAAEACKVEHQILEHVKSALRITLDWQVPDVGLPRKFSSVQFTLQSFQRHIERMMDLEEDGGYMLIVAECKPWLHPRAEALRQDHEDIRTQLADVVISLDIDEVLDTSQLGSVCDEINALLAKIDAHDRSEIELIQEAISMDEGGEG